MPSPILECVPNFSEGTHPETLREIVRSMAVPGVSLLDYSLDPDHNRSVVTIAGPPEAVVESAVLAAGTAARLIDLTRQAGVHPRIGAADVIPFVPVRGCSIAQAAMHARHAGLQIWQRFGVPVYFYGAAATRPDRAQLEDLRRGQFEGLREAVRTDSARQPDIGGPTLHDTAGASVVGARTFLIAYNIFLSPAAEIFHARAIARDLRAANGGLPGVKALGVMVDGRAQVTINITDLERAPMPLVHATVQRLAHQHGTATAHGELIGLIPQSAYSPNAAWLTEISGFNPEEKILEHKLAHPLPWPDPEKAGSPK